MLGAEASARLAHFGSDPAFNPSSPLYRAAVDGKEAAYYNTSRAAREVSAYTQYPHAFVYNAAAPLAQQFPVFFPVRCYFCARANAVASAALCCRRQGGCCAAQHTACGSALFPHRDLGLVCKYHRPRASPLQEASDAHTVQRMWRLLRDGHYFDARTREVHLSAVVHSAQHGLLVFWELVIVRGHAGSFTSRARFASLRHEARRPGGGVARALASVWDAVPGTAACVCTVAISVHVLMELLARLDAPAAVSAAAPAVAARLRRRRSAPRESAFATLGEGVTPSHTQGSKEARQSRTSPCYRQSSKSSSRGAERASVASGGGIQHANQARFPRPAGSSAAAHRTPSFVYALLGLLCAVHVAVFVMSARSSQQASARLQPYLERASGTASERALYADVHGDARILLPAKREPLRTAAAPPDEAPQPVANGTRHDQCALAGASTSIATEGVDIRGRGEAVPTWQRRDDLAGRSSFVHAMVRALPRLCAARMLSCSLVRAHQRRPPGTHDTQAPRLPVATVRRRPSTPRLSWRCWSEA